MGIYVRRIRNFTFYSVLVFIMLSYGCENESRDIASPELNNEPYAILMAQTGCKNDMAYSTWIETEQSQTEREHVNIQVESEEDCVEYTFSGDTLYIKHINACFNCCPVEIYVEAAVSGDTIYLIESEKEAQCHCLCLFDLDIAVCGVSAGKFTMVVKELYLTDKDELIVFDIDPSTNPAGGFCVKRNHYPW